MKTLNNIPSWIRSRFFGEPDPIADLIDHVDDKDKVIYRTVLENQFKVVEAAAKMAKKCASCGAETSTDPFTEKLPQIAVKVLDNLIILRDIVGIQPLTGPIGLIYKLRCNHEETTDLGSRRSLEILSEAIEARSRKLCAGVSFEAAHDMFICHDVNVEEEIVNVIAREVANEILDEILSDLQHDVKEIELSDWTGQQLAHYINVAVDDIAEKTHRRGDNFVVVSPANLVRLQTDKNSTFVGNEGWKRDPSRLIFVGTIDFRVKIPQSHEKIKVYLNPHADPETVLVGYKGRTDIDSGYIFSPYTLLMSSGPFFDPQTFQPQISLLARYGKYFDAKEYYVTFKTIQS